MPQALVKGARKCGVSIADSSKGIETTKFVASFLQKLLGGYKEGEINQDVHKNWQETLLALEEKGRKVVSAGENEVTLTLFCPTLESWKQLHDGIWIEEVTYKMRKLIESLGMLLYFSAVVIEFPCDVNSKGILHTK